MTPQSTYRLISGDCLDRLREMPECSIDAVVTDPPAGIGFMGKGWDKDKGGTFRWIGWLCEVMQEVRRVLKPGGHALVWALPRTSHWTGIAVEMAGFEVRDVVQHIFGSGFPKSLDVGKAIDKAAGVERVQVGTVKAPGFAAANVAQGAQNRTKLEFPVYAVASSEAAPFKGWGTALKPSTEFWWLCRKPLGGTVAGTVLEWGTGALNVDGCRVGVGAGDKKSEGGRVGPTAGSSGDVYGKGCGGGGNENSLGRFPPHLLLSHAPGCTCTGTKRVKREIRGNHGPRPTGDAASSYDMGSGYKTQPDTVEVAEEWECVEGCAVLELGRQSGETGNGYRINPCHASQDRVSMGKFDSSYIVGERGHADTGTAARFFPTFGYHPKPSRAERDAGIPRTRHRTAGQTTNRKEGSKGLDSPRAGAGRTSGARNHHPTVKSLDLMRWLCRLITPEGGTVLDPFMGSGSTGCAALMEEFSFIGIEQEPEYLALARDRIRHWAPMWATDVSE